MWCPRGSKSLLTIVLTALFLAGSVSFSVEPSAAESATVTVFKADGTRFCPGNGKEIPLDEMAKQLTKEGIDVVSQSKGQGGLLHTQVCGAITGSVNTYDIASENLGKAITLGFKELKPPAYKSAK